MKSQFHALLGRPHQLHGQGSRDLGHVRGCPAGGLESPPQDRVHVYEDDRQGHVSRLPLRGPTWPVLNSIYLEMSEETCQMPCNQEPSS